MLGGSEKTGSQIACFSGRISGVRVKIPKQFYSDPELSVTPNFPKLPHHRLPAWALGAHQSLIHRHAGLRRATPLAVPTPRPRSVSPSRACADSPMTSWHDSEPHDPDWHRHHCEDVGPPQPHGHRH